MIPAETRAALAQRLRLEQLAGFHWLPITHAPSGESMASGSSSPRSLADWGQQASQCRLCRLCDTRRHVVFGEGHAHAALMFVGEGPGADEDAQGQPFVGAAGALLTKMIAALGVTREQVYITNMVKCRPPQNRVPLPDELAACRGYLDAQIALIQPRVICALGRTAANALLGVDAPLGALRGGDYTVGTIPCIATFHPAHLLRHPEAKRDAWADLQRLLPYLTVGDDC